MPELTEKRNSIDGVKSGPILQSGVQNFKRFGWRTRLVGLPKYGDLYKYEGVEVRELEDVGHGLYKVEITPGVDLRLPSRFFRSETIGTRRRNTVTREFFSQMKNAANDPDVSTMHVILTGLRSFLAKEVQRIIRSRTHCSEKEALQMLCADFDADDNGTLNKMEFLAGMDRLGFSLMPDDVNVLWPMIAPDLASEKGDEEIEAQKLFEFLLAPRRRSSTTMREYKHTKLMYRGVLKLKDVLSKHLKVTGLTAGELFTQWDTNKGGTLNVEEVGEGLVQMKLDVSVKELHLLWPMLTDTKTGSLDIDRGQWERLVGEEGAAKEFLLEKFRERGVTSVVGSEDLQWRMQKRREREKEKERLRWIRPKKVGAVLIPDRSDSKGRTNEGRHWVQQQARGGGFRRGGGFGRGGGQARGGGGLGGRQRQGGKSSRSSEGYVCADGTVMYTGAGKQAGSTNNNSNQRSSNSRASDDDALDEHDSGSDGGRNGGYDGSDDCWSASRPGVTKRFTMTAVQEGRQQQKQNHKRTMAALRHKHSAADRQLAMVDTMIERRRKQLEDMQTERARAEGGGSSSSRPRSAAVATATAGAAAGGVVLGPVGKYGVTVGGRRAAGRTGGLAGVRPQSAMAGGGHCSVDRARVDTARLVRQLGQSVSSMIKGPCFIMDKHTLDKDAGMRQMIMGTQATRGRKHAKHHTGSRDGSAAQLRILAGRPRSAPTSSGGRYRTRVGHHPGSGVGSSSSSSNSRDRGNMGNSPPRRRRQRHQHQHRRPQSAAGAL
jgi:hypothetical protein